MWDEVVVEVDQSEKLAKFALGGKILNDLDLLVGGLHCPRDAQKH